MKPLVPIVAALLLAACGGGSDMSAPASPPTPTASASDATTPVQINFGDDPADRLLAVNVTVNSVALTTAGGASVTVMSTPRPMEMMRLMGTVAPLAVANVPRGTYAGASMTFGPTTVMHVDPATGQPVQRQVAGPRTGHVTFSAPLVVGTAPMVVNIDMNMWATVGIDAAGNVSMNPALTAHHNPAGANSQQHEDGGLHGLIGMAGPMAGASFSLSMAQGLSGVPLMLHAGTHYEGMTGQGMMGSGQIVSVQAMLGADGTWNVSHVETHMAAGGAMSGGVVTTITGTPATQLLLALHEGAGNGMMASNLAGTTTVNVTDGTAFAVDARGVDLANLPFTPRFDRATLKAGQQVVAFSASPLAQGGGMHGMMGGGTLAATSIRLGQQGLRGTVAGYSPSGSEATFVVTLPADSAFARLTGKTAVTVHQRAATRLTGAATVANGSVVQVRGLLFDDAGSFRLVASRVRS